MAGPSNEDIVRRYMTAHTAHDWETVGRLRDPEWTEEWPQSGERVRGHANDQAIMANYPGGQPMAETFSVAGSEDRWVTTPLNTIHRVIGSGDLWWADGTAVYPDGSRWFIAALLMLRDGKMHHETWYFAPPFEAPAWRAAWVERMG